MYHAVRYCDHEAERRKSRCIGIYIAVFFIYLHFTKVRASRQYDEVRARVLIYDKHLEELETLYKEKENEDISPTIVEEEDEDGKIIDI